MSASVPGVAAERFVFGIPLIAESRAGDWDRVDALLGLTLRSLLGQSDGDFEVLLAGHDLPPAWALTAGDPRFRFLAASHRPDVPTDRNDDAGIKKWAIKEEVAGSGGGLLMYLDADDLVDRRMVEVARARIGREAVGAVVGKGAIVDFTSLRVVSLPDPRVYGGPFHELCGSSTVGRIDPSSSNPAQRDPFDFLGSHHVWPAQAEANGLGLAWLDVWGAYFVNTSQNHSETYGPHAAWRRELNAALAREGEPFGSELAERFGLSLEDVVQASRRSRAEAE